MTDSFSIVPDTFVLNISVYPLTTSLVVRIKAFLNREFVTRVLLVHSVFCTICKSTKYNIRVGNRETIFYVRRRLFFVKRIRQFSFYKHPLTCFNTTLKLSVFKRIPSHVQPIRFSFKKIILNGKVRCNPGFGILTSSFFIR